MNSYQNAIPFLRQQMSAYSQCASDEPLMQLHQEAMACRHFEAILQTGLGLYRSIEKLTNSTEGIESEIQDLVGWWLRPCEDVEKRIRRFEADGYTVDGAEQFHKDSVDARKLMTRLPTTWRGQKVYLESETPKIDFPFQPEPE